MTENLRRTPLHARHAALGARFVGFAGWEMPVQYVGVTKEHEAVRQRAGLFDVSHMGELFFDGPGAAAALDRAVTNDIANLAPGQARYTAACNEQGGILDDLIVYRLAAERFLVVCNAGNRAKMAAHFAEQSRGRCTYADRSDDYALLALQGPAAQQVIAALGAERALVELARFGVLETRLCGVDVICARTGYTGEDGYELFCALEGAGPLWDQVLAAGEASGIAAIGLGARDTLRLEARLLLYGNDIDESTNPYEAGIGWTVKLDKPELIGGAALQAVKRDGVKRKLVGFEMVERGIGRHGYPILDPASTDGTAVGEVTSGAPSLSLGKNVGLGYVPSALSRIGTRLAIEIRGQRIAAEVVPTPFYKRK
ncbi:MAG TPA: glycine cleavage system aminomethyltransferase GcvT [Polyangiales bacterium]|nr:glycine cleavage system aminomethyltransferase GcvT [Polyangiales bacterium]